MMDLRSKITVQLYLFCQWFTHGALWRFFRFFIPMQKSFVILFRHRYLHNSLCSLCIFMSLSSLVPVMNMCSYQIWTYA